jgi:Escherichia/Staphylococcus phage prohead protease
MAVTAPEQRTVDVDVQALDTRGRTVHGYAALYGVLSEDLGGFRETIATGAFGPAVNDDVRALLNHDPNEVLGRTRSGTLRLFDEPRGLRFELDLPSSPLGENVREAVRRGDLDGASFRFEVGEDEWQGEVRTIKTIRALRDVTLATYPAYPDASIELRTRPEPIREEKTMDNETAVPVQEGGEEARTENPSEHRSEHRAAGGLRVEDRVGGRGERRTLHGAFKAAGWTPGTRTEIAWLDYEGAAENRALTWTGSVDNVDPLYRASGPFGADQRYAWPAFPRVPVDSGVTSVQVMTQTARTLPTGASVVRAIDAVTAKPEVASTLTLNAVPMKQVAAIVTNVPNVMLEQDEIESVIGQDLRLSINEGLDNLVLTAIAASGFQAPGTDPLLVSIRKAMTTICAAGYNPNLLILTPAASESLDVLQTVGTEKLYVFGAGRFAPGELFGMSVRVSKTIAAPAVVDSQAFGRLYASPISLASFEADAGTTNRTNVRMEGHAAFGTERQAAAVRIAAS